MRKHEPHFASFSSMFFHIFSPHPMDVPVVWIIGAVRLGSPSHKSRQLMPGPEGIPGVPPRCPSWHAIAILGFQESGKTWENTWDYPLVN